MQRNSKKILLTILILGIFLPVFNARAGIGDIAYSAVSNLFGYSAYLMFSAIGTFMGLAVQMLAWVVNIRIYTNVPIIQDSWKIMRDFANMLFIVALIVMAYGTIFNVKGYDFRSLIPRFLIAALLINFSLVIGGLIIDGTQILNNTFLTAMGDISGRLGQGLEPWSLLPDAAKLSGDAQAEAISNLVASSLLTLIFAIFLAFTFLISVAVPLAVAFVRIPILWALLIVSPLAWLLSILPATRNAYNNWWKQFLAWNLFLPYYLFFMYFALYFLSKKDDVLRGLGQDFIYSELTGLQSNFTFGLVFYYIMIAIFLIGGTKVALNAGKFSGSGIVSVAQWGRGVAMRRFGVTAVQRAAQQKLGEVQKEGLPGRFGMLYGGERGLEEQTARWARRFGVRGASYELQKKFVDSVDKEFKLLEQQYDTGKITPDQVAVAAAGMKANDPKGFAYRTLAAKLGKVDKDMLRTTLESMKDNPLAIQHFMKTAKEAKFSNLKPADLIQAANASGEFGFMKEGNLLPARRELFEHIQSDPLARGMMLDAPDGDLKLKEGLSVLGGHTTSKGKAYLKEMEKSRPDLVMDYRLNSPEYPELKTDLESGFNRAYGTASTNDFQLKTHILGGSLRTGEVKDIANLSTKVWESPEFQEALKIYITRAAPGRSRGNLVRRMESALLNAYEGDKKTEILRGTGATPGILGPDETIWLSAARNRTPSPVVTPPLS